MGCRRHGKWAEAARHKGGSMKAELLYGKLAAPARRALEDLGLRRVEDLAKISRASLAGLHGIGPSALATISEELAALGRGFLFETPKEVAAAAAGSAQVDAYLESCPAQAQGLAREIRALIRQLAPGAIERMAYGMPTLYLYGNLVHFAGYVGHLGFYPGARGIENFQKEIAGYKNSKGAVQFPLDEPLPVGLVRKIVAFRLEEDTRRALASLRGPKA